MTTANQPIKVLVHGSSGRMGREVISAVTATKDLKVVGAVDKFTDGKDHLDLPNNAGQAVQGKDLATIIDATKPHVMIDFSVVDASVPAARVALSRGLHVVIGTTGHSEANLKEFDALASEHRVGIVVAPNFALGAVLLMHLAKQVGRYFDYADIVEAHHEMKIDAPSGTALSIARALADGKGGAFTHPNPEKEPLPGARGADLKGVGVHSIRMPGMLAMHEIILGTSGQTLTLRHDTINRECYMPGIILAAREVMKRKGLIFGLDKVLNL